MYFNRCSMILVDFHWFSSIFVDFHWFLKFSLMFNDFYWCSIEFLRFLLISMDYEGCQNRKSDNEIRPVASCGPGVLAPKERFLQAWKLETSHASNPAGLEAWRLGLDWLPWLADRRLGLDWLLRKVDLTRSTLGEVGGFSWFLWFLWFQWYQVSPSDSKWIQMRSSESKCD